PHLTLHRHSFPTRRSSDLSTDLSSDLNPPLPVAPTDSVNASVDPARVDSGIPRRFHYELRLNIHSVYDDNINISQGVRESDFYRSEEHTSELQSLRHLVCR